MNRAIKDGSYWFFELTDTIPISAPRAMGEQVKFGKHPDGYGFLNFRCTYDYIGKIYRATWHCAVSCD